MYDIIKLNQFSTWQLAVSIPSLSVKPSQKMLPQTNNHTLLACPDSFFEKPNFHKQVKEFNSYLYDSTQFVRCFQKFIDEEAFKKIGHLRMLIQNQTIEICRKKYYHVVTKENDQVTKVQLKEELLRKAATESMFYKIDYDGFSCEKRTNQPTRFMVYNGDCLDIAFLIQEELYRDDKFHTERVAVLNMANPKTPGGGYKAGSGAQEENLHRRTNLYQCLDNQMDDLDPTRRWKYPIGYESGVYSPDVTVFRGSEASGYPLLKTPRFLDIISSAAVSKSQSKKAFDDRNI